MQQIEALHELPKEKRPPDKILWDGTSDDLDEWLDRVLDKKTQTTVDIIVDDVEG